MERDKVFENIQNYSNFPANPPALAHDVMSKLILWEERAKTCICDGKA